MLIDMSYSPFHNFCSAIQISFPRSSNVTDFQKQHAAYVNHIKAVMVHNTDIPCNEYNRLYLKFLPVYFQDLAEILSE